MPIIPELPNIGAEIGATLDLIFGSHPGGQQIGGKPKAGAGQSIDQQILQAELACAGGTGDPAACQKYLQLSSLKAQMVNAGQLQAGSTDISSLLTGSTGLTTAAGESRVAFPFDPKFFVVSGYNYMAPDSDYPDGKHHGTDYGLPSGTPVYAMMQGVAHVYQDRWLGNVVEIRMANGQTARYAHLGAINVGEGQQINAGAPLALSNATGNVHGAHLHFELLDAQGRDTDPEPFLQNVFTGKAGTQALPDGYYTIDGHFITNGSQDDVYYKMAQSIWHKEYGTDPPYSIVAAMAAAGVRTVDDVQAMLNAMPSSIAGVNIGMYNSVNANLQRLGGQAFGVPMSQTLLKQFFSEGITTPEQMQAWFDSHPASDIPKDVFQDAWNIANQYTSGTWNAVPTLDQVVGVTQGAGYTPPKKPRDVSTEEDPAHRHPGGPQG